MKRTIALYLYSFISMNMSFCQENVFLQPKHTNSFGVAFGFGGGLQNAKDITTVTTNEAIGQVVEAIGKPNFNYSIFWEHQWNFHKNHGLLYGVAISYTNFYSGIKFKNPEYSELYNTYTGKTNVYVLSDFRYSFASIDFPLAYNYSFKTKYGIFKPFVGVKMKLIAYIPDSGRNYGGVSTTTSEINSEDTLYYNDHNIRFGTKSTSLILMPTIGFNYSRNLKNGAKIGLCINYCVFLKSMNSVEMYLSNYDNYENGKEYLYFDSGYPIEYNSQTGEWSGVKQSIYFSLNLSSLNFGISYTLP